MNEPASKKTTTLGAVLVVGAVAVFGVAAVVVVMLSAGSLTISFTAKKESQIVTFALFSAFHASASPKHSSFKACVFLHLKTTQQAYLTDTKLASVKTMPAKVGFAMLY